MRTVERTFAASYGDHLLLGGCGLLLALVTYALFAERPDALHGKVVSIELGRVASASEPLRRRAQHTLVWDRIDEGESVYANDTLFVSPDADAIVRFADGTRLALGENTLVVLDDGEHRDLGVSIQQGELAVSEASGGFVLRAMSNGRTSDVRFSSRARGRLAVHAQQLTIDVESRAADVSLGETTERLTEHQRLTQTTQGATVQARPFGLLWPQPGARLYSEHQNDAVSLAWDTPLVAPGQVELCASADCTRVEATLPFAAGSSTVHFRPTRTGRFFWRVSRKNGEPLCATSHFTIVRDLPPRLLTPLGGQIATQPEGKGTIVFAWAPQTPDVQHELDIARDRQFVTQKRFAAQKNVFWLDRPLDEGIYYWRVRSSSAERAGAPFSKSAMFRVTHVPLPSAPELLEATVEVIDQKKRDKTSGRTSERSIGTLEHGAIEHSANPLAR